MALFRRSNAAESGHYLGGPLVHLKVALIAAVFGLSVYGVIKLLIFLSQDIMGNPL